jgi:methyl-accepting chemotaxis protein-3 (ribose and galactose sensor receptor)
LVYVVEKVIPDCPVLLLFFFVVSTVTSVGLIIKSNNSLDNVNKEIQVVLSY